MSQRVAVTITAVNAVLLVLLLTRGEPAGAEGPPAVLRGRALEIVDTRGRVRASIQIHPASTAAGKHYPETVMLRLVDPEGRPEVKLGASVEGGGLGLVGAADETRLLLQAQGGDAVLRLTEAGGKQREIAP